MHRMVMKEGSECEKKLAGTLSEFELSVDRKVTKQLKADLKVCFGVLAQSFLHVHAGVCVCMKLDPTHVGCRPVLGCRA